MAMAEMGSLVGKEGPALDVVQGLQHGSRNDDLARTTRDAVSQRRSCRGDEDRPGADGTGPPEMTSDPCGGRP